MIHKHSIPWKHNSESDVKVVKGAEILSVQEQHGVIVFWEKHDSFEREMETRTFALVLTGVDFPSWWGQGKHLASIQLHAGNYVVHVFELPNQVAG